MSGEPINAKLEIFDPPLCCSTGVCGPSVDPALPKFAADLEWLQQQGVKVERFNLAQQPGAFANNPVVKTALQQEGNDCLPLVLVDGAIVSRAAYPTRNELASIAGLEVAEPISRFTPAVAELVAIGAAIASNCEPCFRYHYAQAKKLGVAKRDIALAVAMAKTVKEAPAKAVIDLAERYLGGLPKPEEAGAPEEGSCCSCSPGGGSQDKCC